MPATAQVHEIDAECMRLALKEACAGVDANDGGPFGSVVVKDGKVIATGHNAVVSENDPTMHSEVAAIRNACKKLGTFDLSGCVLYSSCWPCPMCMGACHWARLDAIYYAATAEEASDNGFGIQTCTDFVQNPLSGVHRKVEHMPVEDHLKPFNKWNHKQDKVQYNSPKSM